MNSFEKLTSEDQLDSHPELVSGSSAESESAHKVEKKRLKEKLRAMKERFNENEGNYKIFDASEINAFLKTNREVQDVVKIVETESQECPYEQRIDILKNTLFELASEISSEVEISQEQIDAYVDKKKKKLLKSFAQFQSTSKVFNYLAGSKAFAYKIRTSGNDKTANLSQNDLDKNEGTPTFLDNLFSQSIYYITPSGMTLRIKLYDIKSAGVIDNAIQPSMEQIFFNDQIVNYTDTANNRHKRVVKVSNLSPEEGKYVFEITTPGFEHMMSSKKDVEQESVKSGVSTIQDNDGIYVNIPIGSILHSGWRVVGVEKIEG